MTQCDEGGDVEGKEEQDEKLQYGSGPEAKLQKSARKGCHASHT